MNVKNAVPTLFSTEGTAWENTYFFSYWFSACYILFVIILTIISAFDKTALIPPLITKISLHFCACNTFKTKAQSTQNSSKILPVCVTYANVPPVLSRQQPCCMLRRTIFGPPKWPALPPNRRCDTTLLWFTNLQVHDLIITGDCSGINLVLNLGVYRSG